MIVNNDDFVCTLFLLWHVSLQIAYLLVNGPDCPPSKLFKFQQAKQMINNKDAPSDIGAKQPLGHLPKETQEMVISSSRRKWMVLMKLALWSAMSWVCILGLCQLALQGRSSITNMFLEWVLLLLACCGLVQSPSYWTRNIYFIGMQSSRRTCYRFYHQFWATFSQNHCFPIRYVWWFQHPSYFLMILVTLLPFIIIFPISRNKFWAGVFDNYFCIWVLYVIRYPGRMARHRRDIVGDIIACTYLHTWSNHND